MKEQEAIQAVQRMQDYIESHLQDPVSLKDLARASGYSPWHAGRIFKAHTGHTLFDYLRGRRLSAAAMLLRDGSPRVLDVAMDFVFDSHEGFTRAFGKRFGISPRQYSQAPEPIALFMPHRVHGKAHSKVQGGLVMEKKTVQTVFVQVVERPARMLLLKRGLRAQNYYEYCEEVGCEVWGVLTSVKEALYEPQGMWLPDAMIPEGTSRYVQGVELPADYAGKVPEGFELIALPPCMMMVFQGEPYEDAEFEHAIDALWKAIENYDPTIYGFEWAKEDAPRFQLEPQGYRGYIEARPVRPWSR